MLPAGNLEGKVAIVTGSSGGIGRPIALELARNGALIACVTYRGHEDSAEETARELATLGRPTHVCALDVANAENVRQMVDGVVGELGALDILNASSTFRPCTKTCRSPATCPTRVLRVRCAC